MKTYEHHFIHRNISHSFSSPEFLKEEKVLYSYFNLKLSEVLNSIINRDSSQQEPSESSNLSPIGQTHVYKQEGNFSPSQASHLKLQF